MFLPPLSLPQSSLKVVRAIKYQTSSDCESQLQLSLATVPLGRTFRGKTPTSSVLTNDLDATSNYIRPSAFQNIKTLPLRICKAKFSSPTCVADFFLVVQRPKIPNCMYQLTHATFIVPHTDAITVSLILGTKRW